MTLVWQCEYPTPDLYFSGLYAHTARMNSFCETTAETDRFGRSHGIADWRSVTVPCAVSCRALGISIGVIVGAANVEAGGGTDAAEGGEHKLRIIRRQNNSPRRQLHCTWEPHSTWFSATSRSCSSRQDCCWLSCTTGLQPRRIPRYCTTSSSSRV